MNFNQVLKLLGQVNIYIIIKNQNQAIIFENHPNTSYLNAYDFIDDTYVEELRGWYHQSKIIYNEKNSTYYIFIYQEVSTYVDRIKKQRLEIERLKYDHLTHLYNRHGFQEKFLQIATKEKKYILAFADIDLFKLINDKYGHDAGDQILKQFSQLFLTHFKSELCGRYGGEEFIIIFQNIAFNDAYNKVEYFRKVIEKSSFTYQNHFIHLTVSFGITEFELKGDITSEEYLNQIISQADQLLYCSKKAGRNKTTKLQNKNFI